MTSLYEYIKVFINSQNISASFLLSFGILFIDYLHLGKTGGEWKIVNVLWLPHVKERETAPIDPKIFQQDGQIKRIIRTELPLLPLKERDRRIFLNVRVPEDISTWGTMDESMRNRIKGMIVFPAKKPAFLSLIPMDGDYLMVIRNGYYAQNALIDIFDPSGRFIIEKELPFSIKDGICRG